jgi:glycosyltransferase involved in cell wall biosynthesis
MSGAICHLIDANIDTTYFRSIARKNVEYPVMIGSIATAGALQEAMRRLNTPTFSLGVTSRQQYSKAVIRLTRLLRREKVSVLHAHCFDPTFVGLIAARIARVPFVFTRHHSDHNIRLGKRWHTAIDAWCARRADHVIAVSEVTRQIMIEIEKVPSNQITVIYNGMEPLREASWESVTKLKQELNLTDEPVVLMLGRLHEEKGHRFLFDAIPQIVSRVGPTVFLLAGDGPHRPDLEAEVQKRNLNGAVRFLGRREDVPELMALSSIVILPSLAESFGFALLEAMSVGKPVVASTTGGIPEVVRDGETGLLVPPGDGRALADGICQLLDNPEGGRLMGEAGRLRAASFTFERMMDGYETIYRRVLERKARVEYGEQPVSSAKREGTLN